MASPNPDQLPLFLTVPMAAELLGVSRATVYRLIKAGDIESRRVGRLRRITREALLKFAA